MGIREKVSAGELDIPRLMLNRLSAANAATDLRGLKVPYDVLLLLQFRHVKPPRGAMKVWVGLRSKRVAHG